MWPALLLAALPVAFQAPVPAVAPAPRPRGWEEFPVFVWREKYAGQPLPQELSGPFGGVILMREEDSAWARERGLSYLVWNVAGRDALHLDADEAWHARVERWIETRDEELLVREPCLNDPETVAKLFATLDATLARHGEHPGLGFVLGDEVSLTPNGDPFDLCRCHFCEAKWKEYAKANRLPERAPLTDEVRLALLENDPSLIGPWLARRRFDQENFLELLRGLAQRARGPERRPVALLGLKGRTAFGGVDLGAVAAFVDVLEAYPVGAARERLDAVRAPFRLRRPERFGSTLATVFLREESPQGAACLVWESWMNGANGLVLWDDADLAGDAERRQRLISTLETVRRIETRYRFRSRRPWTTLGVVSDADSIAAAWLRDAVLDGPTWPRRRSSFQEESGTRERAMRACLAASADLGLSPQAFPLESAEEYRPRVLLLVEAVVVDEDDVTRLEDHLDGGGSLIVVGALGWVDRAGRPWPTSVLERLQARAPERVLSVSGAVVTREGMRALLVRAGASYHEAPLGPEWKQRPWLVRSTQTELFVCDFAGPGPELFVLLPQAGTREARARLEAIELDHAPDPRVEWIHPQAGERLPAGDAAVFLFHHAR